MVERIQQHLAEGRDVYAYFKHEETPEGALYAVDVLEGCNRIERLTQAIQAVGILLVTIARLSDVPYSVHGL